MAELPSPPGGSGGSGPLTKTEQERQQRQREIAERAAMTPHLDSRSGRAYLNGAWGSPMGQFVEMLAATRRGHRGSWRRDFLYGLVSTMLLGLFISMLGVRGELVFLRGFAAWNIAFGVAFLIAGRWGFALGEAVAFPLVYWLVFNLWRFGIAFGR